MTLSAAVFTDAGRETYDDVDAAVAAPGETWVHADRPDGETTETLRERFGLHPLALADLTDEEARPKVSTFDEHTFLLVKTVALSQRDDVAFHKEVVTHSVGLFLGDGWLVTLSPSGSASVDPTGPRWDSVDRRVVDRGTDFLAYRIVDAVVGEYFETLDEIETDIEAVENRVLDDPDPNVLADLNDVRRDLLAFRKVVWPTREALATVARGDTTHVTAGNEKYFRDVADQLVQTLDLVETYRDLTAGSRDIYLNAVSQSTNEVTKTLTVVATIFIPLTFVVGIYGMNFADSPFAMPETTWTFGYPAAMLGMALLTALMVAHFRRREWI